MNAVDYLVMNKIICSDHEYCEGCPFAVWYDDEPDLLYECDLVNLEESDPAEAVRRVEKYGIERFGK